jgi:hypothetical protein
MSTSQHIPSDQPETPATFQRLAPVRERLVTAHLPSVSMNRVRLGTDTRSHAISRSSFSPCTAAGLSRLLRSMGTMRSPVVPVKPLPL